MDPKSNPATAKLENWGAMPAYYRLTCVSSFCPPNSRCFQSRAYPFAFSIVSVSRNHPWVARMSPS